MINKKVYHNESNNSLMNLTRQIQFNDKYTAHIRTKLTTFTNDLTYEKWKNEQRVLWHKKCLYVFKNFRIDVISANHDDSLIEHFDVQKTLNLLQKKYFWFNFFNIFIETSYEKSDMKKAVKKYCEICFVCKRSKASRHKLYDQFQFLFIFEYKWNDLFMNFVIDLSNSRNYTDTIFDSIFVIVCRLTKMIHYISCIKDISFENFADIFIRKIIKLHDFFSFIVTDRKFVFILRYWNFLCYVLKMIRKLFIAFHFQIDD